jgi:hypothetical protein
VAQMGKVSRPDRLGMPAEDTERDFPELTRAGYKIRSPEDINYNCLAFALGDHRNWWEPPGSTGSYWPDGFPDDITVPTAVAISRCMALPWSLTELPSQRLIP